jgi:hypothetical protein
MKLRLAGLLAGLLAATSPAWAQPAVPGGIVVPPGQQLTPEQLQKMREEAAAKAKQAAEERMRELNAQWEKSMLPRVLAPAPASPWLEAEKKAYAEALVAASPKVIVVPPVVPEGEPGIDLSSRITIARLLAAALEPAVGPVPDPGAVFRALGEPRSMPQAAIVEQLGRVRFEWMVTGTVRREQGRLRLTLTRIAGRIPGAPGPVEAFKLDGIELGGRPPELALAPYMADAAAALGHAPKPAAAIAKAAPLLLPGSLEVALPADPATLEGVWQQQLLGALVVPYHQASARPQDRMFERSLAAVLDLAKSTPDRPVLLARSLAYLDRRDAALKALAEGAGTPEEKALAAYLSADLPALQAAVPRVTRPVARLIAELELLRLRVAFRAIADGELGQAAQKLAASAPAAWRELIAVNVLASSLWTLPSSASLKPLLDKNLPVAGYSLQDMARGKAALGAQGVEEKLEAELLLSPVSHAAKWRQANARELCCRGTAATLRQADRAQVLELVEGSAERLALARLEFLARVQGAPARMRRLADLYDEALFHGGHPGLALQRLDASYSEGQGSPDRARLWNDAFENARKVLSWEQSQGAATSSALVVRQNTFAVFLSLPAVYWELPQHPVELDTPARSLWAADATSFSPVGRAEFAVAMTREACARTPIHFPLCEHHAKSLAGAGRKAEIDAMVAALVAPRFNGSTQKLEFLAGREREKGNAAAARKLLQQAVALPYAPQGAYEALGQLLLSEGEIAAAGGVYASFPGLKDPGQGSVGISNYANRAGFRLARAGATREGRVLLERAAANADGSNASMRAAGQLATMSGDYRGGLEAFRQSYQRYQQPDGSREIVSLLFATGQRDAGWAALDDILPRAPQFSPYRAVPVGLRAGNADDAALGAWYDGTVQKLRAASGGRQPRTDFAGVALLQVTLVDREVGAYDQLFENMEEEFLLRGRPAGAPPLPPRAERKFKLSTHPVLGPVLDPYRKGYEAFRRGDHAAAIEAWGKLVASFDAVAFPPRHGDNDGGTFWSGMPYYAISLVKSGRAAEAAKLPERLTRDGRPSGAPKVHESMSQVPMPEFERKMIAGVAAAYAGDHAGAQRLLRGAQGSLADTGARVLPPEYAFVDVLEFLAKDTGQRAYLAIALEFARSYRQFEPWASWAHAFEATQVSGADQVRAAASALRLDPRSMHLKRLDARVLERAREELQRSDPFPANAPAVRRGPST